MEGPSDVFREKIADRVREIAGKGDERALASVLADIEQAIDIDPRSLRGKEPAAVYAVAVSWAALCSDVVAGFYRTQDRSAGWPVPVAATLQRIAARLRHSLRHAACGLDATGYSVTLGSRSSAMSVALRWRTPPPGP